MATMATIPTYGKKPLKIFFSRTAESIGAKLETNLFGLEYLNDFINHDPLITITDFTTMLAY